ncbi:MAG: family transporter [Rhodocyclaceae bacterium]|nr:family transporter [Rhodocyclaceae bacterium]
MRLDRLMDQLLGVFALLVLAGGTLLVVAPFFTALLWGAILAYCTWQPFKRLTTVLGGRQVWAALLIVLFIFCVVLGPIFYAGFAFFAYVPHGVELLQQRFAAGLPPLPDWLIQLPFVGSTIDEVWSGITARNPEMVARLREFAGPMARNALHVALAVVNGLGLLTLSVLFALFFYLGGEKAATSLLAGMKRIAGGERSLYLLALVGGTVKGVVYGILGTSFLQAVLCAVGYWIAGLPSPALLGLATFFLAILPGGPIVVIGPGAAWLALGGHGGWAIFLVVWALVVGIAVDNVLKPMLIGKSSHVPFILILVGVLGGAAAFGFLGVFIGPTLLAVANAVLMDWTTETAVEQEAEPVPVEQEHKQPVPP